MGVRIVRAAYLQKVLADIGEEEGDADETAGANLLADCWFKP
jgi:hypothetical protein